MYIALYSTTFTALLSKHKTILSEPQDTEVPLQYSTMNGRHRN